MNDASPPAHQTARSGNTLAVETIAATLAAQAKQAEALEIYHQVTADYPDAFINAVTLQDRFRDEQRRLDTGTLTPAGLSFEALIARVEALPEAPALDKAVIALTGALEKRDRNRIRVFCGLMADGFPNARTHAPTVYFETLVYELEDAGHSTAVVAETCRQITRTATFLPTVSEVLSAAAKVRETAERSLVRLAAIREAKNAGMAALIERAQA